MIKSIIIDATHFGLDKPTGIELYTDYILPLISKRLLDKGVEVSWIGHCEDKPELMAKVLPPDIRWIHSAHKRMWSQTVLPKVLNVLKPDLYFTPSGIPPLTYKGTTAFTVHDLGVYVVPEAFTYSQRQKLTWISKRSAIKSKLILTPSFYTRKLINKHWRIPMDRIVVAPHGFASNKSKPEAVENIPAGHPYFVYIGRIERKKNLITVIKAFERLALESDASLILAGTEGFGSKEIHKLIIKLKPEIRSRIILPGYISDGQRNWLYENAAAVLVPCPIEGFGLPVLEAFANSALVIAAQSGSLPEVGKDACLYAQFDIPTDWYLQMQKALTDIELRKHLISRGSTLVEEYSWSKSAQITSEAILNLEV